MLEIVVFLCGAVVMTLEMAGSRILAPYLGTSIIVWTSLIGVVLGSLSLGYWQGGRLADKNPSFRFLSLIIMLSGILIAVVAVSKSFILGLLQQYAGNVHLAATLATLVLFAPPSVLLGMVSPYSVRLKMNDVERSGKVVGNLYAVSTLGSIVGTFLGGFFLIAFFGSSNILLILAVTLLVASLLASREDRLLKLLVTAFLVLAFLAAGSYDRYLAEAGLHDVDTNYNRVLVYSAMDKESGRLMEVMSTNPKAMQSAMYRDDPAELALDYTKFYNLAFHFKRDVKKILMLGGGGYSFPKYALSRYPAVTMEVVEIDPGVTDLARRFFALPDDPRLLVRHEDGRTFLNRNRGEYDVILGDTFNSHYSVPFHLATVEAVKRMHALLPEDGVVLMNILSAVEGDGGRFLRAECATFKAVFPQVYLYAVDDSEDGAKWRNFILAALKSPVKPNPVSKDPEVARLLDHLWKKPVLEDVPILTDDYAPVDRYISSLQ